MRIAAACAVLLLITGAVAAQQGQIVPLPPAQLPQAPPPPAAPPAPSTQPIQPGIPAPVVPAIPLSARTFTATSGLIFTSVRPERVRDFETVIAYLQEAQRTATDPAVRTQAQGWKVFKVTDPGPNSSVLYVFVIDPVVPSADYSLGPILAAAYPDRIQEIWKLYTGAIIQQSIANLTPFVPPALPPAAAPAPATASPPAVR